MSFIMSDWWWFYLYITCSHGFVVPPGSAAPLRLVDNAHGQHWLWTRHLGWGFAKLVGVWQRGFAKCVVPGERGGCEGVHCPIYWRWIVPPIVYGKTSKVVTVFNKVEFSSQTQGIVNTTLYTTFNKKNLVAKNGLKMHLKIYCISYWHLSQFSVNIFPEPVTPQHSCWNKTLILIIWLFHIHIFVQIWEGSSRKEISMYNPSAN